MTERLLIHDIEPQSREKYLLHQGTMMFMSVNKSYPASLVAQGAEIARRCQVSYQNPLELHAALVGNHEHLRKLTHAAIAVHHKSGNEKAIKTIIIPKTVKNIMTTGFNWAYDMMVLEPSQLQKILNQYPKVKSAEEIKKYRLQAFNTVARRRAQLGLPPDETMIKLNPATGYYSPRDLVK